MSAVKTQTLTEVIVEHLNEGVSVNDIPELVLSEHGFEIVRPQALRFIRDRARALNRTRRRAAFTELSSNGIATVPLEASQVASDPLWSQQWLVLRSGLSHSVPTTELTIADIQYLQKSYQRLEAQHRARAEWFGLVLELAVSEGITTLGELKDKGIELPSAS
jgi:hypothetical protein